MYFLFFVIISPWKRALTLNWANVNPLHTRLLFEKLIEISPVVPEKMFKFPQSIFANLLYIPYIRRGTKFVTRHFQNYSIPKRRLHIHKLSLSPTLQMNGMLFFQSTVPATLTFTFLSYPIVRVSYPIVRLSYPLVRVSYQVFRLSYRENLLSGFAFILYQVLRLSGLPFIVWIGIPRYFSWTNKRKPQTSPTLSDYQILRILICRNDMYLKAY